MRSLQRAAGAEPRRAVWSVRKRDHEGQPGARMPTDSGSGLAPSVAEEVAEQLATLLGTHAPDDLDLVVQTRIPWDVVQRADRTRLGVVRSEDHSVETGQHQRAGTHRARLEGDVQAASIQPPGTDRRGCGSQGEDLRMGGRVAIHLPAVVSLADDLITPDHDRPDRHVVVRRGLTRRGDRHLHPPIVHAGNRRRSTAGWWPTPASCMTAHGHSRSRP